MSLVEPFSAVVDDVRERIGRESNRLAQVSEATAWVIHFGSSRTEKSGAHEHIAAGPWRISRNERLALERPGWSWWDREASR